ncbi:unnamed protein product [Prorocentrum cordatum]|uniref:60S ribosomal export protein NMD3 n=1 Tax=Prorocentrum cordatum TaxID=2364126 RepID=A0ABN9TJA7_9DINO|nr:unnamed protein product [Polarella glacialis]
MSEIVEFEVEMEKKGKGKDSGKGNGKGSHDEPLKGDGKNSNSRMRAVRVTGRNGAPVFVHFACSNCIRKCDNEAFDIEFDDGEWSAYLYSLMSLSSESRCGL